MIQKIKDPNKMPRDSLEVRHLVDQQLLVETPSLDLPWHTFPEALDPAAGELDPDRARRKRQQAGS